MTPENLWVSPDVKSVLPDILIDYLYRLALSCGNSRYKLQTFELDPGRLGGQSIQNILHMDKPHRIFGVTPVSCKLCVLNSAGRYEMILAN